MGFANHDETGFGGKPDFAMNSMISLGESFDEERFESGGAKVVHGSGGIMLLRAE